MKGLTSASSSAGRDLFDRSRLVLLSYFLQEYVLIRFLCSPAGPGPVARRLFRIPFLYERLGLWRAVPGSVLILTTVGRKTGLPRRTPMAYRYDSEGDVYYVVPGWGKRSDWYLNLRANARVQVKVAKREFATEARAAPEEIALRIHDEYNQRNPFARRVWPTMTGEPFDPSPAGLAKLVEQAPVVELRPPR